MKKLVYFSVTLLTVLLLAVSGIAETAQGSASAAGATTTDVEITVTYGQTEARNMLALINEFRTGSETWYWNSTNTEKVEVHGLQPLTYSYELEKIAMVRAAEIALSFSHTRPNGESTFSLGRFNGENIAAGYRSKEAVMEGWKETDLPYSGQGHRRNMLNTSFTHVGIGHAYVNGYDFWVQDFGISSSVGAETPANNAVTVVIISVDNGDVIRFSYEDSFTMTEGDSVSVSSLSGKLLMTESWPSAAPVAVRPSWTADNSDIVAVENETAIGRGPGHTAIKTTLFGRTVNVNVTVTCLEHTWGAWKTTKEATCTKDGSRTHTCTVCGTEATEKISALGHDYTKTVTPPTCTAKGYTTYTCSRGDHTYKDDATNKLPHTWGEWTVTKAATCTKTGTTSRACAVCSETETQSAAMTPHDYIDGVCAVCGSLSPDYRPPVETEPPETEPVETEPPETEPIETEPPETEPPETEPVETEPVETEPVEPEPVETEPTAPEKDTGSEPPAQDTDTQKKKDGLIWTVATAAAIAIAAAAIVAVAAVSVKRRRNGKS